MRIRGRRALESGGARRDRTADLLLAKQALSQLSYGPLARSLPGLADRDVSAPPLVPDGGLHELGELVGLGRVELPTSPLSGVRSNQLSYRPGAGCPEAGWIRASRTEPGNLYGGSHRALERGSL
jgi:hypothetical protein